MVVVPGTVAAKLRGLSDLAGKPMVDVQDTKHARGPVALQYGAGTVKFRKVEVR